MKALMDLVDRLASLEKAIDGLRGERDAARAERDALQARVVALETDAARYFKLRAGHWSDGDQTLVVVRSKSLRVGVQTYSAEKLDEAIDAALKETQA